MRTKVLILAVAGLTALSPAVQAGHPTHRGSTSYGGNRGPNFGPPAHIIAPHTADKHPFKPVANKPEVVAAQQEKLSKLKSDLDAVAPNSKVPADHKATLQKDLFGVVDGSNKPQDAHVTQLSSDLTAILAHRSKSTLDTTELAQHLKTVMNTAYMPPVNVTKAIKANETLLKESGLSAADVQVISKDLKNIADALKGQAGLLK